MRLSQAIRLGALIRPQAFGRFFKDGGSCVFGAALETVGFPYTEGYTGGFNVVVANWPYLSSDARPGCNGKLTLYDIYSRNDDVRHRWTREAIADWVEQRERELGIIVEQPAPSIAEPAKEEVGV